MKNEKRTLYQAHEFAELAGVTVRTLHHYDHTGLLKPTSYTEAGYRLYGPRDLARLQQIVTLKFIGLSLKQIKEVLSRDSFDLQTALRLQRESLEEKRRQLDMAVEAIERAEKVMSSNVETDWEAFKRIIEVITMENNMDWTNKYYSEEAKQKIKERADSIGREAIEQSQRDWAMLIKEVETAVAENIDPASERAQALAARWSALIRGFTGGDPEIQAGLRKMYADQANWPSTFPKPYSDEAQNFIFKAMAAGQK